MDRAKNLDRLRWAGDPERTGGKSRVLARAVRAPADPAFGEQVLRVQMADLRAVAWDLFVTYTLVGLSGDDDGLLALDLTIGTGQATSRAWWLLAAITAGTAITQSPQAAALGWLPPGTASLSILPLVGSTGVAISGQPIVACALSARPVLIVSRVLGVDHNVGADVLAHCAPRAWVP